MVHIINHYNYIDDGLMILRCTYVGSDYLLTQICQVHAIIMNRLRIITERKNNRKGIIQLIVKSCTAISWNDIVLLCELIEGIFTCT